MDNVTISIPAHLAEDMTFSLMALGLKVGAAFIRAEGKTKEEFVQMCAETWDEFEAERKEEAEKCAS